MTLDEAIKHCEDVAEEQEKLCKVNDSFNFSQPKWKECAKEHRQLAEWLKELKELRGQTRWIPASVKGLFIPGITAEMFRNRCLESIETLMAEGEIYDIEYSPWRIANGMSLPKGHGRLIDADALLKDVRDNSESYFADDFAHEWVDVAPTIIEADRSEDEK